MTTKRKMISLLLALVMVLSFAQVPVMATEDTPATAISNVTVNNEPIESAFTDAAFLTAVRELVGKTNGEPIYSSDVEGITRLKINGLRISSLDGVEHFTSLKELLCWNNALVVLDLSHNSKLEYIDCSFNASLNSINVTNCPELNYLDCNSTSIERLDVRNNPKLNYLACNSMPLRTLNISQNPLLETLDVYEAHLTTLDVTNNPNLYYLDCSYNDMLSTESIQGLDGCPELEDGDFYFEPQNESPVTESFSDENFLQAVRESINKPEDDIYPEDLAGITELEVNNSGLTSLDGIEYMTSLESLDCTSNRLSSLDLYSNKELKTVQCADNNISELDMSGNEQLIALDASRNTIASLTVENCPNLKVLNVSKNALRKLDLKNSSKLESLSCSDNQIDEFNKIELPESITNSIPTDVDTSKVTIQTTSGFVLDFFPQLYSNIDIRISTKGINSLEYDGTLSSNQPLEIYDITEGNFTGIPEEYLEHEATIESKKTNNQQAYLKQLMDSGVLLGTDMSNGADYVSGVVNVKTQRDAYKILAVTKKTATRITAQVIDVDSTLPYVTKLIINNNRNKVVDLMEEDNPVIWTYSTGIAIKVKLANQENVDKVFVHIMRVKGQASTTTGLNTDIELRYIPSTGMYEGTTKISGGETATRQGTVAVKCTQSGDADRYIILDKSAKFVFDPSGYIYEGVPSNRLTSVKTTLYYKDRDGMINEWNAEDYNQTNPIYTDQNGGYKWFVPFGLWQVKAELDGYETYYTDWMRVPPAKMDVNFGLISNEKPRISQLNAYPDLIEINLNKYVYASDISGDNVVVYANSEQVPGSLRLVNAEVDYWEGEDDQEASGGTGNRYVSKLRFFPQSPLALGDNVRVSLNENIRSYASVTAGANSYLESTVELRPAGFAVGSGSDFSSVGGETTIYCGETKTMKLSLMPFEATSGKKLIISNCNSYSLSVPTEVIIDENGIASIPMTGLSIGTAELTITLENSNLSSEIIIDVDFE